MLPKLPQKGKADSEKKAKQGQARLVLEWETARISQGCKLDEEEKKIPWKNFIIIIIKNYQDWLKGDFMSAC